MADPCLPCIERMLTSAMAGLLDGEAADRLLREVREALPLPLGRAGPECPRVIGRFWRRLVEESGVADPLAGTKSRQNEVAQSLLPAARELVLADADPFRRAVELAILSNSMDALFDQEPFCLGEKDRPIAKGASGPQQQQLPASWLTARADAAAVRELETRAAGARSVAYLADNCGEAVFDRLLLEALRERGVERLTYITRTLPVLNDVTLAEARALGLGELAELLPNGIDEHLSGTDWGLLSHGVRRLVEEADLVIVKGGGNYKSLMGEPALVTRAVFLFQGKCALLCEQLGVPLGTPVIRVA